MQKEVRLKAMNVAFFAIRNSAVAFYFIEPSPCYAVVLMPHNGRKKALRWRFLCGVMSVSYTHLDVYKRQDKHYAEMSFKSDCEDLKVMIDFITEAALLVDKKDDLQASNVINLPIDAVATNVILTPTGVPAGAGTDLYLLQIEFYQEVNAVQYSLKNGAHNALSIVEVA